MEAGSFCAGVLFVVFVCMCRSGSAEYQNFTVGETEGWTSNPSVPYSTWASDKNFSLGDFLIFKFAKPEYNVIRTYNETVYRSCDYMSSDSEFEVWGQAGVTESAEIALVRVIPNYFFCGVNDSKLCQQGMKFGINVSEGDGLPASLAIPPPAPINETSPSQPTSPNGDGGSNKDNHDANRAAQYRCSHWRSLLVAVIVLPSLWALSK